MSLNSIITNNHDRISINFIFKPKIGSSTAKASRGGAETQKISARRGESVQMLIGSWIGPRPPGQPGQPRQPGRASCLGYPVLALNTKYCVPVELSESRGCRHRNRGRGAWRDEPRRFHRNRPTRRTNPLHCQINSCHSARLLALSH